MNGNASALKRACSAVVYPMQAAAALNKSALVEPEAPLMQSVNSYTPDPLI